MYTFSHDETQIYEVVVQNPLWVKAMKDELVALAIRTEKK